MPSPKPLTPNLLPLTGEMHPDCPRIPPAAGVFIISQPPRGDKNSPAYCLDQCLPPAWEVSGQHLAPPIVGHVVYLAQQVERERGVNHLEAAALQDFPHLAGGQ